MQLLRTVPICAQDAEVGGADVGAPALDVGAEDGAGGVAGAAGELVELAGIGGEVVDGAVVDGAGVDEADTG